MSSKAFLRLKDALAGDEAFLALVATVKGLRRSLKIEHLLGEVKTLHEDRSSRKLYKSVPAPLILYEANLKDKSHRARMTTIRASMMREVALLERLVSRVKKMILSDYAGYLDAWSNQPARAATIDLLLSPAITLLADMQSCQDIIDFYIKDIDQMAYGLTNSVELLKLTIERRDQIV